MALGQHLRADQHARARRRARARARLAAAAARAGVAVDARERRAGKTAPQRLLDALGALAHGLHVVPAARAGVRAADAPRRSDGSAAAARAGARSGAHRSAWHAARSSRSRAEQRRRVAAAVEEQQHLAAGVEMPLHGREQRGVAMPCVRGMRAQVDQVQRRRRGAAPRVAAAQARWRVACATLCRLSSDGVAEPSTTARRGAARAAARGRAPNSGTPSCCLYDASCSSSTTIEPGRAQRRKHRRARADHDRRRAAARARARPAAAPRP